MVLGASILVGVAPLATEAATIVWENSGTTFSTGANWVGGVAPANNLTTDIGSFQAATASFNPRLTASRSINGLEFTSGTGAWTFSGNSGTRVLTIGSGGIVSNDDSTQTFNQANLGIRLGANAAFTSNSTGALLFGATLASFNLQTFTLTLAGSSTNASNSIAEPISGTGGITKSGTGTWTLSGASTYTGVTTINAGTLSVATIGAGGVAGNLGAATTAATNLVLGGGTLQYTGATASTNRNFTLTTGTTSTIDVTTNNLTISGASANTTGGLTKAGAGTLTLSGANLHTGTTTVSDGTLAYGASNALSTGGVTVSGGTLSMGTFSDTVGAVTLTSGSITGSTGVLTGTSYDVQSGSVTAILGGAGVALTKTTGGTVTLSGANTYTGATTISAGTLQLNASNVLSDSTAVSVASGATFNVNDQTETIATLAGAGAVSLGAGALTTAGNADTTFSGTLSGTGSLTKSGTGTLTIGSDLGFGGDLNLTAGTLQFDVDNAFTGTTTISAGTLRLSSSTLTLGTLNVTGNSTIDFAGTASTLNVTTFNISVGVVLNIINWTNATDYFFAQNWSGAVVNTRGSAPMNQVVFTGFTGNDTQWQSYDDQVTPVPEPATYGALLLGALTGFFAWRRGRRAGSVARAAGHAQVATGL